MGEGVGTDVGVGIAVGSGVGASVAVGVGESVPAGVGVFVVDDVGVSVAVGVAAIGVGDIPGEGLAPESPSVSGQADSSVSTATKGRIRPQTRSAAYSFIVSPSFWQPQRISRSV